MYFDTYVDTAFTACHIQWLLPKLGSQAYFNTVCFSFAVKMEAVTNQLKELRERKVSRKASRK